MDDFMDELVSLVFDTPAFRKHNYDEFVDRLSSKYTVNTLVIFALLSLFNLFAEKPMTCFTPAHFEDAHSNFADNYCWIRNTYYLPWENNVPSEWNNEADRQMITYYQWIPFILIAQAILFYLPKMLWRALNSRSSVDCDDILKSAQSLPQKPGDSWTMTLRMLTNQIDEFLNLREKSPKSSCGCKSIISVICCGLCRKRWGNYLLLVFLFSKVCYIVNVIGQMFLLNVVLSTRYSTFGFDMVNEIAKNKTWFEDSYVAFPRVTLCDFEIRGQDMGNVQRYTIQCVLPMNLFNEMIYICLWYWMVFVACASCFNFLFWILRAIISIERKNFVENHLNLGKAKFTTAEFKSFFSDYLRQDGCLLLRLIATNTNDITTSEIASSLFAKFKEDFYKDEENTESSKAKEAREDKARKAILDDEKTK